MDRLCTGYAVPIPKTFYAALYLTHLISAHIYVRVQGKEIGLCKQNKCEFITVQRGNAHYSIDAGLTPPYTQQSIKSRGDGGEALNQNHWG